MQPESNSNLQFQFEGQTAVVTGGARGIGLEITRKFLTSGARVLVWENSIDASRAAAGKLAAFGTNVMFQDVDVANLDSVGRAVAQIDGEIDILVNNAGITRDKSLAKMTDDDFTAVIETNLSGVFRVTQALLPKFRQTGTSPSIQNRIINLASVVALYGNFGQTNYVAAKAGVIGMTKTWARELGRKGFTVNAIAPGFTQTAMVDKMPLEARAAMESKIAVGRLGQVEDIAHACLFLASREAGYVNGTVLSVDGGLVS